MNVIENPKLARDRTENRSPLFLITRFAKVFNFGGICSRSDREEPSSAAIVKQIFSEGLFRLRKLVSGAGGV